MVEFHLEAGEIGEMVGTHSRDQILFGSPLGPGPDHDRRAVRVIGAEVDRVVSAELLEADEDVGLDVFDEVPEVILCVGVGLCGRDEDPAAGVVHGGACWRWMG